MAQRMDIELTAQQDESTWTWRAAGAKLPKGSLNAKLLYEGAKVGDVARAEADKGIDGIEIVSVAPPFKKTEKPIERIEIQSKKKFEPVTTTLAGKKRDKRDARRPRSGDDSRSDRGDRGARSDRNEHRGRSEQRGSQGPRRDSRRDQRREESPQAARLVPKMKHRGAILDTLEGQQRRIAELLLKGGLQAVRKFLELDAQESGLAGASVVDISPLMTAAEDMWPSLKTADWMDKAEAAQEIVGEISLRDLRSVVTMGDANARTDESRVLAQNLREALDKRVEDAKTAWLAEMETCLTDARIVRALKVSARPPDSSIKFPAELAQKLTEAANAALSADVEVDRWLAILDAVTISPVRRAVVPAGLPADKDDPRLEPARSAAAKIPSLIKLFGITIPPPPVTRAAPSPRNRPPRSQPPRNQPMGFKPSPNADKPLPAAKEEAPEPKDESVEVEVIAEVVAVEVTEPQQVPVEGESSTTQ